MTFLVMQQIIVQPVTRLLLFLCVCFLCIFLLFFPSLCSVCCFFCMGLVAWNKTIEWNGMIILLVLFFLVKFLLKTKTTETTLCLKKFPPLNALQLCQILTDFQNVYTAGKRLKFTIKPRKLPTSPRTRCYTTLGY